MKPSKLRRLSRRREELLSGERTTRAQRATAGSGVVQLPEMRIPNPTAWRPRGPSRAVKDAISRARRAAKEQS